MAQMIAPFPYVGGKRRIASLVWESFGSPNAYIEPFGGSLAILLGAPTRSSSEIVNDANHFVTNFWRALRADWKGVLDLARDPVTEVDYKARHLWLVTEGLRLLDGLDMVTDPDAHDVRVAAWWAWGQSVSIGRWCLPGSDPDGVVNGLNQRPTMDTSTGIMGPNMSVMLERLAERLHEVRVLSGSWERCITDGMIYRNTPCAVFLDPPYRPHLRDRRLYGASSESAKPMAINDDIEAWCRDRGSDPRLRIVLAGLEGEYDLPDWRQVSWRAPSASSDNRDAERLWLSPHCIAPSAQEKLF